MEPYKKIQVLLRLAELCGAAEAGRREKYMDQIDEIIESLESCEVKSTFQELEEAFNFDAPTSAWKWREVRILKYDENFHLNFPTTRELGMMLAALKRKYPCIRYGRSRVGVRYFLPPLVSECVGDNK